MDILREGWENLEPAHQSPTQFLEQLKTILGQASQLTLEALGRLNNGRNRGVTERYMLEWFSQG